jgi:hypothetical protein
MKRYRLALTFLGCWTADFVPFRVFERGTWVLAALMTLSALGNFASSSAWERFLNGPVALVLALLCFVVAVGARRIRPDRFRELAT